MKGKQSGKNASFHFERPRLNVLFKEAVKYPLVVVCAGAGYGKTSAVYDFTREYGALTLWMQLSGRDNAVARFWESFIRTVSQVNKPFADELTKLGFPYNDNMLNQYFAIAGAHVKQKRRVIVIDDFHFIEDPAVFRFAERCASELRPYMSLILISRVIPKINSGKLITEGRMFNVSENDLRFTEQELNQYFGEQKISAGPDVLHNIMQDTKGWAFTINLIARSYQKAPGYEGYLRNAVKTDIFNLMETEIWEKLPVRLQLFLIRLSLVDHLSAELISLLAKGDESLLAEFEKQSAYVRRDGYTDSYLIHHLFLEFLRGKQKLLPDGQKRETYEIAAAWCDKNGFKTDALAYYEKIGAYESIVSIFFGLPLQVPYDIASYAAEIFKRIPDDAFDSVDYLAATRARIIICLGLWREAFELTEYYEAKYLKLPQDNAFRSRALGGIYYCQGILRLLMCTTEDVYDFDACFAKMDDCFTKAPANLGRLADFPVGPWINMAGASRENAPQEYLAALSRAAGHISHCLNGAATGIEDLAAGELKFYQGNVRAAEYLTTVAFRRAREKKQFDITQRALFLLLRIAVAQGDYQKVERALSDMRALRDEKEYSLRLVTFDIASAWYYCVLRMPDMVPDWLKERFTPYGHMSFIENFGNQMKAGYFYLIKNYQLLLACIQEHKRRESALLGRVEMLATEACVHYKLRNKSEAFAAFGEAYESAMPNNIIMPFIELGKDTAALASAASKDSAVKIPKDWIETVRRKSASYEKQRSHIIFKYKQAQHIEKNISMSARELEILTDLSHGLSRGEIAVNNNISINTVKMVINNIYSKFGAGSLAELIRAATERKLI